MKKFKRIETVGHIQSTFWSPFHAYYMFCRSFRSQESNTSNGPQIGVQNEEVIDIGSQSHQAEGQFRKLRNQPFLAKWTLSACKIFAGHVTSCEIRLCAPRYLRPTLLDFFFRYLLFKSPFSPCNPPIIGFLSQEVRRKGE